MADPLMSEVLERPCVQLASSALHVSSLSLHNFRNYASLHLVVHGGPVVLVGDNGAGKTNLLEAVSFLTPGRGLRRARLLEVERAPAGDDGWAVAARIMTPAGETALGTGREPGGDGERRAVRINGAPARGHTDLGRAFTALWLTPQMDQLFQEGASGRRKFLDRLVYSFDSDHASRVNGYEHAMRERNRLLSQSNGWAGREQESWLTVLERKMAEITVAIAVSRNNTVERLNKTIMMSKRSFPKALIGLGGWMEDQLSSGVTALAAEDMLTERLAASRRSDAASGRSSEGAHKTELRVHHMAKGTEAARCSTGEQKALLLSMVLAQARAGKVWHGIAPVLLLDEVVAHLDATRRAELFEEMEEVGAQAWMTGTDAGYFEGLYGKAQFFTVKDGTVTSISDEKIRETI